MRVEVRGLSKAYPTPAEPLVVLDCLDLEVEAGGAVAVTGPSGCGKSTLLHVLGTLETPDAGSVRLGGADPFAMARAQLARFRNRAIGFVFQEAYLLPQLTALENVLVPTLVAPRADGSRVERAQELLERVGLGGRVGHRPVELSGGERQRVAIARALVNRPGLLLADEPTGNLDGAAAERVADLLFELQRETGTTLVLVTHSQELAARCARRLALRQHRLVEGAS